MMKKDQKKYEKYVYLFEEALLEDLQEELKGKGIRMKKARRFGCEVVHPRYKVAVTSPEIWRISCQRQGSWYRSSPMADKFMIGSDVPIDCMSGGTHITVAKFTPPRLPTPEEIRMLANDPIYQKERPDEWERIQPMEETVFKLTREKLGADKDEDVEPIRKKLGLPKDGKGLTLKEVFVCQCANHANFINPKFYTEENGNKVPYSIGGSMTICSSCMEYFGIIGSDFPVRYVTPCTGAVMALGMDPDIYMRVENL
jgi:hypothetical protein